MFDLAINNGNVADVKNGLLTRANIGIKDGKIESISQTELTGIRTVDASGMVVSPGFIDIHMHEDQLDEIDGNKYIEEDIFKKMVLMGVTTCIGGNCGIRMDDAEGYFSTIDKQGISLNFGAYLGYSNLREKIGAKDNYKPLTKEEIQKVKNLIRAGLEAGALGLSFGLEYTPGSTTNEMIEIAEVLNEYPGKLLSAHFRYDANDGMKAIKELIYISWVTGVPMQISHIGSCTAYGMMDQSLALLEKARSIGIDVMADCYPYNAFSTYVGTAVFDGDCFGRWGKDYNAILVSEGKYAGKYCTKEIFEYIRENEPNTLVVAFVMDEKEVEKALVDPLVMIASDGLTHLGQGHPRAAGTFPRVLSQYVRDKKSMSLLTALSKMTIMPAERLGLSNKGSFTLGSDADIVIFDPNKIRDKADFEQPSLIPEGVAFVIVNGKIVAEEGRLTGEKPGKAIRFGDNI